MSEQTGWICPKCGRVYAPWVKECDACNPVKTAPIEPVVPWYPTPYLWPWPDYPGTGWPPTVTYYTLTTTPDTGGCTQ